MLAALIQPGDVDLKLLFKLQIAFIQQEIKASCWLNRIVQCFETFCSSK